MSKSVERTLFERYDLSQSLLRIHHQRLGIPSEIIAPPEDHANCREQVRISRRLIRDLKNLSGWILAVHDEQTPVRPVQVGSLNGRSSTSSDTISLTRQVRCFDQALTKAEKRCDRLLSASYVGQRDFDRLGVFVCRAVARLHKSRSYSDLRRHSRRSDQAPRRLRGSIRAALKDRIVQRRIARLLCQVIGLARLIEYAEITLRSQPDRSLLTLLMVHSYYRFRRLFMEFEDVKRFLEPDSRLRGTLSFAVSALRLEAGRSLKKELRHLDAEPEADLFYDRLERAIGILRNGLEQTLRQLLEGIGSSQQVRDLLDDPQQRRQQESVHLVEDLQLLRRLVQRLQDSGPESHWKAFLERLQLFKKRSLYSLYHQDRQAVERFEEELRRCPPEARAFHSHRFQIFLTTLLAQVHNPDVLTFCGLPQQGQLAKVEAV
ncbi:MAG: hypothetical protein V3T83_19095 [Acidobacteriota bacterium]